MNNTYGFILAAGLGTRLKPYTDDRPKALVEVADRALLDWNIEHMISQGIEVIVINVFHFAEKILDFINEKNYPVDIRISDERPQVLETGGGLLFAKDLFAGAENILIWNVDILSRVNVQAAYDKHVNNDAMATLLVSDRPSSRKLLWKDDRLVGWKNVKENQYRWVNEPVEGYVEKAFSGIHFVKYEIFDHIVHTGKFSILETYFDIARKYLVEDFDHTGVPVLDVGKPEALSEAREFLLAK